MQAAASAARETRLTARDQVDRKGQPSIPTTISSNCGVETRRPLGDGRKRRCSFRVTIAITAVNGLTILIANALYASVCRGDIEGAARAYGHASVVGSLVLSFGNDRLDRIPCLKPLDDLGLFGACTWEAGSSIRHIWRHPCPIALMSKGRTPLAYKTSGVDAPTQAASTQCVLSRLRVTRLNLVPSTCPTFDR